MTARDFAAIFARVRPMFARYEADGFLLDDSAGRYMLGTHELRPKDGYRTWFGGVEIRKSYVSVHLIPVYVHPDLKEGLTDALRKRMQGKSCFNFKELDEGLLAELDSLVARGFARFAADGRFRH